MIKYIFKIYINNVLASSSISNLTTVSEHDGIRLSHIYHFIMANYAKNITLEDVAQQVGFSETSTFHRAFKKWTGVTPGLYRQLHGYH